MEVLYYTDPCCPWSWAFEPAWRKLLWQLGDAVSVRYVMCGMARSLKDVSAIAFEVLDAAAAGGMPVDTRLWLAGDPPRSSHPACMAIKAAEDQGVAGAVLRRLREGFMCRRRRLDGVPALVAEVRGIPGLDAERFRRDLESNAVLESFGADLERAQAAALEGEERVKLPSLAISGGGFVSGFCAYEDLVRALPDDRPAPRPAPAIDEALRSFGPMATAEVASVCDLPGPRAPAALWAMASEWRARWEPVGSGELWTLS